jgi:hypothetical protein
MPTHAKKVKDSDNVKKKQNLKVDWEKLREDKELRDALSHEIRDTIEAVTKTHKDDPSIQYDLIMKAILQQAASLAPHEKTSKTDWYGMQHKSYHMIKTLRDRMRSRWINNKNDLDSRTIYWAAFNKLRDIQNAAKTKWIEETVREIESAKPSNPNMWTEIEKLAAGPFCHHKQHTLLPKMRREDGTQAATVAESAKIFAEHFKKNVFSRISSYDESVLQDIPRVQTNLTISGPPTMDEFKKAIKLLANRKAPGASGVPAELFKVLEESALQPMFEFLGKYWNDDNLDFTAFHNIILKIIPKKGDLSDPNKWRGIALGEVPSKIISMIALKRIQTQLMSFSREEQNGFLPQRGCADAQAALKITLQTLREHKEDSFVLFLDLVKAFDTVNREMMLKILQIYGVPQDVVTVIKKLYNDVWISFDLEGEEATFESTSGVKQGDVLAPTLFLYVMQAAFDSLDRKWDITSPTLRWHRPTKEGKIRGKLVGNDWKNKGESFVVRDIMYADDAAVIVTTRQDLLNATNMIIQHLRLFGLQVHVGEQATNEDGTTYKTESKTEVMFVPGAGSTTNTDEATKDIVLTNNSFIPFVNKFKYLGSTITTDLRDDVEIKKRIATARGAFSKLSKIFDNKKLKIDCKTQILKTFVLTALLYGCENWSFTEMIYQKLEVCYNDFLRGILGYSRYYAHYVLRLSLEDIRKKCGMPVLRSIIHLHRARWLQKIAKMDTDRLPKRLLNAWKQSPRMPHRPQKTIREAFRTTLSEILKREKTWKGDLIDWIPLANNDRAWSDLVEKGLGLEKGQYYEKTKRKKEKER